MKNKKEFEEKNTKINKKELFFTNKNYLDVKNKIAEHNKKQCSGNRLTDFFV